MYIYIYINIWIYIILYIIYIWFALETHIDHDVLTWHVGCSLGTAHMLSASDDWRFISAGKRMHALPRSEVACWQIRQKHLSILHLTCYMGMDQYLLIPFLGGWTSIYQLFWCSPGVQGFDTLPHLDDLQMIFMDFPILVVFFRQLCKSQLGEIGSKRHCQCRQLGHPPELWLV